MNSEKGFTLVEIMVVIALAAIAIGFALLVSVETYRGSNFRTERNMVVALLERARSQSVANYCQGCEDGKPHGVFVDTVNKKYILYQGESYASRDAAYDSSFEMSPTVTVSGLSEVNFAQLTAVSSTVGGNELVLTDSSGRYSTTTIGLEGQISWSN